MKSLADTYQALFLAHQPESKAKMTSARSSRKYSKVLDSVTGQPQPITQADIESHLRGTRTFAVSLVGMNGLARAAALDIDEGGEEALKHVLAAVDRRGLTAFAITSSNVVHDSGHVWLLFNELTEPVKLRRLAASLARAASIDAETYPTQTSQNVLRCKEDPITETTTPQTLSRFS